MMEPLSRKGTSFRPSRLAKTALAATGEAVHDSASARADALHVHADTAGADAVVRPAPREIRNARARNHRLGRRAAFIDARSPYVHALDQGGVQPSPSQRRATLTRADDNRLVRIRRSHKPSRKPKY